MADTRILHIFRRDLRIQDNTSLYHATKDGIVYPCFIVDPRQVDEENSYRSLPAIQFMRESLTELRADIEKNGGTLNFFYGTAEHIVEVLLKKQAIDAVYHNRDYTPFSQERDAALEQLCKNYAATYKSFDDALLNAPGSILRKDKQPYVVFSPFHTAAQHYPVAKILSYESENFAKKPLPNASVEIPEQLQIYNRITQAIPGGRSHARALLRESADFIRYQEKRDFPAYDGTTKLSAHIKFGTISAREMYHAISEKLGTTHPLNRQLYWRDFFTHIAYHFPKVFGNAFYNKFNTIQWKNDAEAFKKWCAGETGFPLVDAGMRELNTTGYMHNRVRMVVASFLVKDLHIDWRWGERYFASKLIDYDPCVNNGNWQWAASTGCDAQPYFRIFNPWLQQKRFDPECRYIKRWIPELKKIPQDIIQNWETKHDAISVNYPKPIVDHKIAAKKAKDIFKP